MKKSRRFSFKIIEILKDYIINNKSVDELINNVASLKEEFDVIYNERKNEKDVDKIISYSESISKYEFINSFIEIEKEKNSINTINNKLYYEIIEGKHTFSIIETLYNNPGIRHKDLAGYLNLHKDTLTRYINSITKYSILNKISDDGKKAVRYYLTDRGYKVYEKYINHNTESMFIGYLKNEFELPNEKMTDKIDSNNYVKDSSLPSNNVEGNICIA